MKEEFAYKTKTDSKRLSFFGCGDLKDVKRKTTRIYVYFLTFVYVG